MHYYSKCAKNMQCVIEFLSCCYFYDMITRHALPENTHGGRLVSGVPAARWQKTSVILLNIFFYAWNKSVLQKSQFQIPGKHIFYTCSVFIWKQMLFKFRMAAAAVPFANAILEATTFRVGFIRPGSRQPSAVFVWQLGLRSVSALYW